MADSGVGCHRQRRARAPSRAAARCAAGAAALFATLLAGPGVAGTLAPGGQVASPDGVSVVDRPQLQGTVVENHTSPFRYEGWTRDSSGPEDIVRTGDVFGRVQSQVVLSTDGTYDFYWRIAVDPGSFLSVASMSMNGWAPATHFADWRSDLGAGVVPAGVQQSTSGSIGWFFGQYLPPSHLIYPGERSVWFFLDTDATAYAPATFGLLSERDSGGSMMFSWGGSGSGWLTFAPTAPVPEPATVVLGALGLAWLWARVTGARRRAASTMRRCPPVPVPPKPPSPAISDPA